MEAGPSAAWESQLEAIEARVAQLESMSRMLLAHRPGGATAAGTIPVGVPVREYMQTMGSEMCTMTHNMLPTLQVQPAYGRPDKLEEHAGYVGGIYSFPDGKGQLSFHFVNDLCVLAH